MNMSVTQHQGGTLAGSQALAPSPNADRPPECPGSTYWSPPSHCILCLCLDLAHVCSQGRGEAVGQASDPSAPRRPLWPN